MTRASVLVTTSWPSAELSILLLPVGPIWKKKSEGCDWCYSLHFAFLKGPYSHLALIFCLDETWVNFLPK